MKCEQYWPDKGSQIYGDLRVTTVREDVLAFYTLRTFNIEPELESVSKKKKGELQSTHTVYQYQYTAWPDHGVPLHALPLISFIRNSAMANSGANSGPPIVVHCRYSCFFLNLFSTCFSLVLVLVGLVVTLSSMRCCSRLLQGVMLMYSPFCSIFGHKEMDWFRQRSSMLLFMMHLLKPLRRERPTLPDLFFQSTYIVYNVLILLMTDPILIRCWRNSSRYQKFCQQSS